MQPEVRQRVRQEDGAEEEQGQERRRRGGEKEQKDKTRDHSQRFGKITLKNITDTYVLDNISIISFMMMLITLREQSYF